MVLSSTYTGDDDRPLTNKAEQVFGLMMAAFIVVIVLTNIIGTKLFLAFPENLPNGFFGHPVTLTAGLITYPLTFLLTDIVCEVFGKKRATLMVLAGFVMSLIALAFIQIALILPGSPVWPQGSPFYDSIAEMQKAYESVFFLPGILIFASMSAYVVAQLMDVRLFHFWKRFTRGKHLWLRNNASTMISQLFDTAIVNSIFLGFGLGLPWHVVAQISVANYIFKVAFAAIDTPFIYLGVAGVRRWIGEEPPGTQDDGRPAAQAA